MMQPANKFTAARFLQAKAIAKGFPHAAIAFAESQNWTDRNAVVGALKAAVDGIETGDYPPSYVPVAESFLAAMRDFSVPLRLEAMRRVPMLTRVYVTTTGIVAAQVAQGAAIPVLAGTWTVTTLEPKKFAGIAVATDELMQSASPQAQLGIVTDLAEATAEAENRAFVSPLETGSILDGAYNFASSGTSVAQIDGDLRGLVDAVPGADKPGGAFLMTKGTAAYLATVRGSGGARAFPEITPQGGTLMGLPVIVTSACEEPGSPPTRVVALCSPSEILWADEGRVELSTSQSAALKMADDATSAAGSMTSLFQAGSTATKAVRESSWYARSGATAYFTAAY